MLQWPSHCTNLLWLGMLGTTELLLQGALLQAWKRCYRRPRLQPTCCFCTCYRLLCSQQA